MKKITSSLFSLSLITISSFSSANECAISNNMLSAYYDVTSNKTSSTHNPPLVTKVELHRKNTRVLKRNVPQGINDIWTINGSRLSLNRAFDQYKHTIEYQSNELGYQPNKQNITQIVATPELAKMQKVSESGTGCTLEQNYRLQNNNTTYTLVWLPTLKLIKSYQVETPKNKKEWLLTSYQNNEAALSAIFTKYDNYQSTDYADIGDNESIPFLAKMINQGFSTAQQSNHSTAHHGHEH